MPRLVLTRADADALHEEWERQQRPFLNHRDEAFAALAATVRPGREAEGAARVLDLAGGTGGVADAVRTAVPGADIVLADADPVLLAIGGARHGHDAVVHTDLRSPSWLTDLPRERFDTVLVGNALHCFAATRLRALYREVFQVLRPGGVLAIAEPMPQAGLDAPGDAAARAWADWWDRATGHPALATAASERARRDLDSADFYASPAWHRVALHAAGYVGIESPWRRDDTVVMVATTPPLPLGGHLT